MINIKKRNGSEAPINYDAINFVVGEACKDLNVSPSEVIRNAQLQFVDGMTTERIQEILIKSAEQLITPEEPDYQYVASRLTMYDVRKRAYGQYYPPEFIEHYQNLVDAGIYDPELLKDYTAAEFQMMEEMIDHRRDRSFSYAAAGQLVDKYLLRDRSKKRAFYESPQMMYMAIAATLLREQPIHKRMELIKTFYDGASQFKFSLPTPIMAGVRTPTRQFSSCVLIKCGDSLPSINATATAITNYVSKRAGIGVSAGAIRAIGSPIRNGEMVHTGLIPFLKYHVGALKSCSQGGVRGGSATFYYPWWHLQIEDILVLKNNRGIEENRERRADYGMEINGFLFDKFLNGEDIYLFDPKDVKDMYDSFYSDQGQFEVEYNRNVALAESGAIRHKRMKSSELIDLFVAERTETGRIYAAFVDNMNDQGPFNQQDHPIYQSNLCAEIALPTREFEHEFDDNGRIALCTLASFNMSQFIPDAYGNWAEELNLYAEALIAALDGLLSYQDYPQLQAELATREFRTLGVGVVNLADFLAQQGLKYGTPKALKALDVWMERFAFSLTNASVELAANLGPCELWEETCYGAGAFPFELRKEAIDRVVKHNPQCDWEGLRKRVINYGIRNATLMAVAPTESSSQVLNATNGVEMPKGKMAIKASKSGMFKQIVPSTHLMDQYEYLWDNASPRRYLTTCAVLQKWIDQSISTNTFYNPELTGGKIDRAKVIMDIIEFHSLGGKTLYYSNVNDAAGDGTEKPEAGPECDTCVV